MDLGSGIRKKSIPDPGVKKAPDPGSRIRIRNTASDPAERAARSPAAYTHIQIKNMNDI
jgi:hypothetical protein